MARMAEWHRFALPDHQIAIELRVLSQGACLLGTVQ